MRVGVSPWHVGTTTRYGQSAVARFPARSVAVTAELNVPAVLVSAGPAVDGTVGPEVASATVAGTETPNCVSSKVGAAPHRIVGGVASRMTVVDAVPVPP